MDAKTRRRSAGRLNKEDYSWQPKIIRNRKRRQISKANRRRRRRQLWRPVSHELTVRLTQLVEHQNRLLETQNHCAETGAESKCKGFRKTPAGKAATVFNDIVLELKLKFPPTVPRLDFKALPSNQIELTWTEATNNPDRFEV